MDEKKLLCVDCYDLLAGILVNQLTVFYCQNIKGRRFGVLTIGGLSGEKCEKILTLQKEKTC